MIDKNHFLAVKTNEPEDIFVFRWTVGSSRDNTEIIFLPTLTHLIIASDSIDST